MTTVLLMPLVAASDDLPRPSPTPSSHLLDKYRLGSRTQTQIATNGLELRPSVTFLILQYLIPERRGSKRPYHSYHDRF
jgi:hypothetical protein